MTDTKKHYLGDGVYVEIDELDSSMIRLFTSDGRMEMNNIFLERRVLENFQEWLKRNYSK